MQNMKAEIAVLESWNCEWGFLTSTIAPEQGD